MEVRQESGIQHRLSRRWLACIGAVFGALGLWLVTQGPEPTDEADSESAAAEAAAEPSDAPRLRPDIETNAGPTPQVNILWQLGSTSLYPTRSADDSTIGIADGPIDSSNVVLATGNPLTFLDVSTGDTVPTTLLAFWPVMQHDDKLVVYSTRNGRLATVELGEPFGFVTPLNNDGAFLFRAEPGREPGTVVALSIDDNDVMTAHTFDIATGAELSQEVSDSTFPLEDRIALGGEFQTPRTGGVFRFEGSASMRVGDGALVAQGDGFLLVERCDDALVCDLFWHDSTTFDVLDLPIPDGISDGRVIGDGQYLVFRSDDSSRESLFDLERGGVLVEDVDYQSVSLGPDGRLATFSVGGSPFIIELDTLVRHDVDGINLPEDEWLVRFHRPLLIDMPNR